MQPTRLNAKHLIRLKIYDTDLDQYYVGTNSHRWRMPSFIFKRHYFYSIYRIISE